MRMRMCVLSTSRKSGFVCDEEEICCGSAARIVDGIELLSMGLVEL